MYVYMYVCVCVYVCVYVCIHLYVSMYFFYLQHVPLQIVILHTSEDHSTRFILYTFPRYFNLIPMAVCVLFGFLDL